MNFELALSGALPALAAMWYFDRLDAKRPEPRETLRLVAVIGGLCFIPVLPVELLLQKFAPAAGTYAHAIYKSFVVASFTEEAAKLAVVMFFVWKRPEFDERMDGIVYATQAGLGFALVENILYLLQPQSIGKFIAMYIGRAVLAVPMHAIAAGFMGYYAAKQRFDKKGPGVLGGFLIAVTIHGAYDAFLFSAPIAAKEQNAPLVWICIGAPILIVAVGGILLRLLVKRAIAEDDADERLHPKPDPAPDAIGNIDPNQPPPAA